MLTFSDLFRNQLIDVLINNFTAGSKVQIFTSGLTPVKLIELTVSTAGGFQRSGIGTATLFGLNTAAVMQTGVAAVAVFLDPSGRELFRATCGLQGSNSSLYLTNTSLVAGTNFSIQSTVFAFPETIPSV